LEWHIQTIALNPFRAYLFFPDEVVEQGERHRLKYDVYLFRCWSIVTAYLVPGTAAQVLQIMYLYYKVRPALFWKKCTSTMYCAPSATVGPFIHWYR
jgi:hypothetical protein